MDETEIVFKDFTKKRKKIRFRIDEDFFDAVPALLPTALQEIVTKFRAEELQSAVRARDIDKAMQGIQDIFGIFLFEDSYEVFVKRMSDRKNPIDIYQLIEIVTWIIGVYTNRPLEQSGALSDGSQPEADGTSSVDGVSLVESIQSQMEAMRVTS
jgi:hypothetical protein